MVIPGHNWAWDNDTDPTRNANIANSLNTFTVVSFAMWGYMFPTFPL